jgi:hypothetical protein
MIEYVKVTNDIGESITLELRNPEKSGFFIRGIDGLGPTKNIINTSDSLTLDGSYFNTARASARNILLDLGFYDGFGAESGAVELARLATYRFFPIKKPIEIEIKTDNRVGITTGYLETNEPDIFSPSESTKISLLCPSAYFYSKDTIQTVFSGVTSLFEFPFENPSLTEKLIEFGQIFINTESNVFYNGDVNTGVVIYINCLGSANDITIINASNGETMAISSARIIEMTGSDLVAGDLIVISTIRGSKFIYLVRGGNVINILNALTVSGEWFRLDRGDNVFTYTADSGLSNLQFLIEHRIVYLGM